MPSIIQNQVHSLTNQPIPTRTPPNLKHEHGYWWSTFKEGEIFGVPYQFASFMSVLKIYLKSFTMSKGSSFWSSLLIIGNHQCTVRLWLTLMGSTGRRFERAAHSSKHATNALWKSITDSNAHNEKSLDDLGQKIYSR